MTDFHPEAIPCPYPHSSVDVDEVIFYCRGNFTSRKGVSPGSISHHPAGIAHGPHPGAYAGSIGSKDTHELAVMLDVLNPLIPTARALEIEDGNYHDSFIP
jgi:homogentisate 1,2-dioxygenase